MCFLQECSIPYLTSYLRYSKWWTQGPSVWSGGNDNKSSGVAILFKSNDFNISEVIEVVPGRVLCVDSLFKGNNIRFINVYASPLKNERMENLSAIPFYLAISKPIVLEGDFNCVTEVSDRIGAMNIKLDKTSKLLEDMVKTAGMIDVGKQVGNKAFTWSNASGTLTSRIDFSLFLPILDYRDTVCQSFFLITKWYV